jgi:centromeric protein E
MVGNQSVPGIIEMTIDEIFSRVDHENTQVNVGYLEIYNERVFDLLDDNKRELKLLEYQNEVRTNQKKFTVVNREEVMRYFHTGNQMKHMGESLINKNSSRSHTIFRISVESIDSESGNVKSASMFLVDLAGSEKPDVTKESFGEGLYINKSLLSLGKIIRQLADKNVNVKHIRYRESILTRLLSSSLGGNSFTSIICTASKVSLEETFNTIW